VKLFLALATKRIKERGKALAHTDQLRPVRVRMNHAELKQF
jgi:hypothetical protein